MVGLIADQRYPSVLSGSKVSAWSSKPARRSLRRVTRPESGVSAPASRRNSEDFPSPLRPTIPIRAPSLTPRVTDSSTTPVA